MKYHLRLLLNSLMAGIVLAAWVHMCIAGGGVLAHEGFSNLRFYTVLSNLLESIASLIWIVAFAKSSGRAVPPWVEIVKYIAAVSVFLTFTIVAVFLGPLYGHENLYLGANLWFHLLIPVMAVLEMMFLSERVITAGDNRLALYPTILYGVVYVLNNVINGIGTWPDTNDWYGFLLWGYPIGILIFIGIGVGTWALGRFIRLVNNRRLKEIRTRETQTK